MTPKQWYQQKRKEYLSRYGIEWKHLYIWGELQSSEVCETALRSGIECYALQANGSDEIEMIANAIMIRDYLKRNRNSPYKEEYLV
jgi:hypothetical protein